MLNANGRHIYIGANDDASIYGVDNVDEIQLEIKDRIKNKILITNTCKWTLKNIK